jgi:hypothetical protein
MYSFMFSLGIAGVKVNSGDNAGLYLDLLHFWLFRRVKIHFIVGHAGNKQDSHGLFP